MLVRATYIIALPNTRAHLSCFVPYRTTAHISISVTYKQLQLQQNGLPTHTARMIPPREMHQVTKIERHDPNKDIIGVSVGKLKTWVASLERLEAWRDKIAAESRARWDDVKLVRHHRGLQKDIMGLIREVEGRARTGERVGKKA